MSGELKLRGNLFVGSLLGGDNHRVARNRMDNILDLLSNSDFIMK